MRMKRFLAVCAYLAGCNEILGNEVPPPAPPGVLPEASTPVFDSSAEAEASTIDDAGDASDASADAPDGD